MLMQAEIATPRLGFDVVNQPRKHLRRKTSCFTNSSQYTLYLSGRIFQYFCENEVCENEVCENEVCENEVCEGRTNNIFRLVTRLVRMESTTSRTRNIVISGYWNSDAG